LSRSLPPRSPDAVRSARSARVRFAWLAAGIAFVAAAVACTPSIGDQCQVSTDCSVRGDRLCDVSQPGGYCTQLNCGGNACADEAACVLFNSAVPGCGYNDRSGPFGSRVARSFCMAACTSNGDCRAGYVCADPRTYPWNAVVLDNVQNKRACLPIPLEGQDAGSAAPTATALVCGPSAPDAGAIDAAPPVIQDGGVPPLFAPTDAGSGG